MKRIFVAIFLLVGIGLLLGAWTTWQDRQDVVNYGREVTATIVTYRTSRDSDGDTTYAPVYEYEVDGQRYRKAAGVSTGSVPTIGASERAWVDREEPENIVIDNFMGRWFAPVLMGAFGAVLTFVGLVIGFAGGSRRTPGTSPLAPPLPAPTSTSASTASSANHSGPFVKGNRSSDNRGPFL